MLISEKIAALSQVWLSKFWSCDRKSLQPSTCDHLNCDQALPSLCGQKYPSKSMSTACRILGWGWTQDWTIALPGLPRKDHVIFFHALHALAAYVRMMTLISLGYEIILFDHFKTRRFVKSWSYDCCCLSSVFSSGLAIHWASRCLDHR